MPGEDRRMKPRKRSREEARHVEPPYVPEKPLGRVLVSVSLAQWRAFGRTVRGALLTTDRYRSEHATTAALVRKGLWHEVNAGPRRAPLHGAGKPGGKVPAHWVPTSLGREVYAARNGVLREASA